LKVLLDQGLPLSTAHLLRNGSVDTVHTAEIGMATAADREILARALIEERVVITLDADFHSLLALSGATKPSVVRFRIEGLRAEDFSKAISNLLDTFAQALQRGTVISVRESSVRLRHLPLG